VRQGQPPSPALPGDGCLPGTLCGFTWEGLEKTPEAWHTPLQTGRAPSARALLLKLGIEEPAVTAAAQLWRQGWEELSAAGRAAG